MSLNRQVYSCNAPFVLIFLFLLPWGEGRYNKFESVPKICLEVHGFYGNGTLNLKTLASCLLVLAIALLALAIALLVFATALLVLANALLVPARV